MKIKDAIKILGVTRVTFYAWEDKGKIKVDRKGRTLDVSEEEVMKRKAEMEREEYWIRKREEAGKEA